MTEPIAATRLKSFIERIETLEGEKRVIADDIGNVYSEAKGVGFDVKTMRAIVKLRKKDEAERDEQEQLLDLYKNVLGMAGGGSSVAPASAREIDEAAVARATNDKAVAAVRLLRAGKSVRAVADELGLSHGTAQRLCAAIQRTPEPVPEDSGTPPPAAAAVDPIPAQNIAPGDVPAAAGQFHEIDGSTDGRAAKTATDREAGVELRDSARSEVPAGVESRPSMPSPTAAAILADAGPMPTYLRRVRA